MATKQHKRTAKARTKNGGKVKSSKVPTRDLLISVAERLFAQNGIEAVSMRQIGEVAAMANNSAVQYHFGDKNALMKAVFDRGQNYLRSRRRELLAAAHAAKKLSTRDLLEILLRPVMELVDEKGVHLYAMFLWQLRRPELVAKPPFRIPYISTSAQECAVLLRASLRHLPGPLFDIRLRSCTAMFLHMLISQDWISRAGQADGDPGLLMRDCFDMIHAALAAPVSDELTDAMNAEPEGELAHLIA